MPSAFIFDNDKTAVCVIIWHAPDNLCSLLNHVATETAAVCVQTLSEPFFTDRKGEIPEGKKGYYAMPIVHCHNGLVTVNYGGEFIQVRQQHADTM